MGQDSTRVLILLLCFLHRAVVLIRKDQLNVSNHSISVATKITFIAKSADVKARLHTAFFSSCDCVFGVKFIVIFKFCSHGAFLGECNSDLIFVCFAPDIVLKKPCAIVLPADIVLNPFSDAKIQIMTPEISN